MTPEHLQAIRDRANAAMKGPWMWWGEHESRRINLCTRNRGMIYVMTFERWGMQGAQPVFNDGNLLVPTKDIPIFQVAPDATSIDDRRVYRGTMIGIRNPNAAFIAHSRQDVDDLLAYIDHLEAELAEYDKFDIVPKEQS